MGALDKQEKLIVRELIRDPRISDNQIAHNTQVPLKTVNRKRKNLEEQNILSYYAYLDTTMRGTGAFSARHLYIVTLLNGITRQRVLTLMQTDIQYSYSHAKHIMLAHIGERDGQIVLIFIIESRADEDIVEIFNADLVPQFHRNLGDKSISSIEVIKLTYLHRLLHNYIPSVNMKEGKISPTWSPDLIFVDD